MKIACFNVVNQRLLINNAHISYCIIIINSLDSLHKMIFTVDK